MTKEELAAFTESISAYNPIERSTILQAAAWAEELHRDQKRASGEDYIIHPLGVASILSEMNMDAPSLVAALLHDSIEDSDIHRTDVADRFGEEVAAMVDGVTKIADLSAKNKTQQEAESIRKMLFAMVQDIRVILIKLADKLHNMRTLQYLSPERQKAIAQECLDIYAPLADRLGISWLKDELEDLALKHLNREAFDQIKGIVALKRTERAAFLERVQNAIHEEAAKSGLQVTIKARAKHFYSIYKKMRKRNKGADELYDLLGLRILCEETNDCYTLLGIVHRVWKPIEGRFKDYIAMPKANGYQSLHTTVMGYDGQLIEIQIRTTAMHSVAEYGVASHWAYKQGASAKTLKPEDISIVSRLKTWQNQEGSELGSSLSFLETIKKELLKDSIFVFTPKGNVVELPSGSTPIDFAYHIHTAIGEHCIGAKADGSIVPLSSELQNTQVVEILTAPQAHPHINWLRAVRTSKARSKIRAWLLEHDESLVIERNIVAKKKAISTSQESVPQQEKQAAKASEAPADSQTHPILNAPANSAKAFKVRVEDEGNMMIRFAQCCRPVTGDPITGYVSRGRGIIVHRQNCKNVQLIPDFAERQVDVEWENAGSHLIKRFRVESKRTGDLFSEIEGAVRKYQGHLIEGRLEENGATKLTGYFTVELENKEDLKKILKGIRGIPSITWLQILS